jgi:hypothetical protein
VKQKEADEARDRVSARAGRGVSLERSEREAALTEYFLLSARVEAKAHVA